MCHLLISRRFLTIGCVFFLQKKYDHCLGRAFFGKGIFDMPLPFDVPATVLKPIGMTTFRIHSGNYAIQENHEFIIIDF